MLTKDGAVLLVDTLMPAIGTMYVGLLTSVFVEDPDYVLTNVLPMEASFPGYSRQPLNTWAPASPDGVTEGADTVSAVVTFIRSVAGPDVTIYGYFVVNGANRMFILEKLTTPMTMPGTLSATAQVEIEFQLYKSA
jgi:hypothetical protein